MSPAGSGQYAFAIETRATSARANKPLTKVQQLQCVAGGLELQVVHRSRQGSQPPVCRMPLQRLCLTGQPVLGQLRHPARRHHRHLEPIDVPVGGSWSSRGVRMPKATPGNTA
jgi:hypothetical protein